LVNQFSANVCYNIPHQSLLKLDCLFRNASDALHTTEAWDKQGISLHFVDMGGMAVDTSSAMGRMMLTMLAGFAQFERDLCADRTKSALKHKKSGNGSDVWISSC